jgi:hypothetical protein
MTLPPFSGETPFILMGAAVMPQSLWIFGITIGVVITLNYFYGLDNDFFIHIEYFLRFTNQRAFRIVDMAFLSQLVQDIDEASLCPDQGIRIDSEILSNLVCCDKANPVNVPGKTIRVVPDYFNRLVSILFIDFGRIGGAHSVA